MKIQNDNNQIIFLKKAILNIYENETLLLYSVVHHGKNTQLRSTAAFFNAVRRFYKKIM